MLLNFALVAILSIGPVGLPAEMPRFSPETTRLSHFTDLKTSTAPSTLPAVTPAMTPTPKPSALAPKANLGVFASVAISAAKLPSAATWRDARTTDYTSLFSEDCAASGLAGCDTSFSEKIRGLSARTAGLSDRTMLDMVNRTVNAAMTYRSDAAIWGKSDYWASPVEMAMKGAGDCEDFAIAKYWALRGLGLADDQLQMVVLQDTRRQLFHAVLVVHTASGAYVLDNVTNNLRLDTAYAQYQPIMSFAGDKSYIHGFAAGTTALAAMPKDLASVTPGASAQ